MSETERLIRFCGMPPEQFFSSCKARFDSLKIRAVERLGAAEAPEEIRNELAGIAITQYKGGRSEFWVKYGEYCQGYSAKQDPEELAGKLKEALRMEVVVTT